MVHPDIVVNHDLFKNTNDKADGPCSGQYCQQNFA